MQNRQPTAPNAGAPLPAFAPVPRKCARHDGWTPARQRAFIEALADTGSVSRAAAQVNMSTEGAYYLRASPVPKASAPPGKPRSIMASRG